MASKEILSSSSSLKRPSVSLSSRFIRSSSVQGQLDRRTDSRERGRTRGRMGICTFPIPKRERDLFPLPPLLSSPQIVLACVTFLPSLLPSSYPFPALPSPLPLRRCRHHISWPQKGICSRERIRPLPSPPLSEERGLGKAKRVGASEGFRILRSSLSSHPRISFAYLFSLR